MSKLGFLKAGSLADRIRAHLLKSATQGITGISYAEIAGLFDTNQKNISINLRNAVSNGHLVTRRDADGQSYVYLPTESAEHALGPLEQNGLAAMELADEATDEPRSFDVGVYLAGDVVILGAQHLDGGAVYLTAEQAQVIAAALARHGANR